VGNDDAADVRRHATEEHTRWAHAGRIDRTTILAWTVLAAATLVQACGGLAYSFAVYAEVGSIATSSVIAWGSPSSGHRPPFLVRRLALSLLRHVQ
jgi:hypothetical protein